MIADPSYIRSDWQEEEYIPPPRQYRDTQSGKTFELMKEFRHYDDVLEDLGDSVNNLILSGRLCEERTEYPTEFNMSLAGALYASGSKESYGALRFKNGEEGAGFLISTVHGDGVYPVYGERLNGVILRIYVDLQ